MIWSHIGTFLRFLEIPRAWISWGPPPSHFSACIELTLLCLMPSAMLALNITLLTDFICLPTQLAIAQLSAYMLKQHCETPNVECKTFGELHSHRPINHPCRPGDPLYSSRQRAQGFGVQSSASTYLQTWKWSRDWNPQSSPSFLGSKKHCMLVGSGLGKEIALALHCHKARWTLLSTPPPVLLT